VICGIEYGEASGTSIYQTCIRFQVVARLHICYYNLGAYHQTCYMGMGHLMIQHFVLCKGDLMFQHSMHLKIRW